MKHPSFAFFVYFLFFGLTLGLSPTYKACQVQKSSGESALNGCPDGTFYVSATDPKANFTSIQKAIDSLPETGTAVILIGAGEYNEMLNVARSDPLRLLGQVLPDTNAVSGGNGTQLNTVTVWNQKYVEDGESDEATATLTVFPASGHSFGNVDLKFYNINFENRAADYSIAPALVTSITLANASFYGCGISSYQDSWYTGWGACTYMVDSVVYGQTDFIFGCGLAWFQSSIIALRGCGGAITAWEGESGTKEGVYIADSSFIRSPDANATTVTAGQCYLGRPWNTFSTAIFLRNWMDDSIAPAGFKTWDGQGTLPSTVDYAEYVSKGPGWVASARVAQEHILTEAQAESYTLGNVFGGWPEWIDNDYQY